MSYQVFILVIIAVILWGATPVVEKTGFAQADTDPFIALAIRSIAAVLGVLLIVAGTGKFQTLLETNFKTIALFALSGILAGLLGTWAYLSALKLGEASRVVPISATYPLVTAFLSFLILKEDFSLTRIAGTCLIVIGIWLLK